MKPYSLLFTALLCLITHALSAQKEKNRTPQYKYAFKGYLNFWANRSTTILTKDTSLMQINSARNRAIFPSIALSKFQKNGRFWEMGITRLGFDYEELKTENKILQRDSFGTIQRDSSGNLVFVGDIPSRGARVWTDNLAFRFEWNFPFFCKKNNRFNPYLGIAIDPSVYFQKIEPFTSATFPTTVFELSNTFSLIPRVTYALSNRCFLDLNVPISVVTFSGGYRYENNPILPSYARETIDFRTRLPTHIWVIRLGIGYKI